MTKMAKGDYGYNIIKAKPLGGEGEEIIRRGRSPLL
jgi:hypothetical protein